MTAIRNGTGDMTIAGMRSNAMIANVKTVEGTPTILAAITINGSSPDLRPRRHDSSAQRWQLARVPLADCALCD
jgi:hypothetical protein